MKPIELAKAAGTSVHTVRYYERIGLLRARRNPRNGYREFDSTHLERLAFIRRCRLAGMPLAHVEALIGATRRREACAAGIADIVRRALAALEIEITELDAVRERLRAFEKRTRRRRHGAPTGGDVRRLVESLGIGRA